MAPSPVTIAYEYERPRFAYSVECDGERREAEANYCVRRDGRLVFVEVTDIVTVGSRVRLERSAVLDCPAAAESTLTSERVGTDVWELQVIRSPSLLERLVPWWWPPDTDESPFDDVGDAGELVHPDAADLSSYAGEVVHSLGAESANGR